MDSPTLTSNVSSPLTDKGTELWTVPKSTFTATSATGRFASLPGGPPKPMENNNQISNFGLLKWNPLDWQSSKFSSRKLKDHQVEMIGSNEVQQHRERDNHPIKTSLYGALTRLLFYSVSKLHWSARMKGWNNLSNEQRNERKNSQDNIKCSEAQHL